jgi:hypothetical protein
VCVCMCARVCVYVCAQEGGAHGTGAAALTGWPDSACGHTDLLEGLLLLGPAEAVEGELGGRRGLARAL